MTTTPSRIFVPTLALLALAAVRCSGDDAGRSETGGAGGGGTGGGSGAGTGGSVGTGGTGVNPGTGGCACYGGSPGAGGVIGSGGIPGAGGNGMGGAAGSNGAGGAPGSGGRGGNPGSGGAGGALHGGSAARFICPSGVTYGDPLAGIGAVQSIAAPNDPPGTYFGFIEGPIWIASVGGGTLFFSDNVSPEKIFKLNPPSTTAALFKSASGSNGLAVDNNDKIVVADQAAKRIVRMDPATGQLIGSPIAPAGSYKPNDVIVRSDDNVYFTDPDTGFYRVSPSGALTGPLKQVNRPNGIELSPDEATLYVGDVGNKMLHKMTLAADGSVNTASDALFATTVSDTADGMCVDCAGNVYAGTKNGVEVFSPSGARLGVIPTGESSNCTFGDADRRTLYVTSRALLKYVRLAVPGLPD